MLRRLLVPFSGQRLRYKINSNKIAASFAFAAGHGDFFTLSSLQTNQFILQIKINVL